MKYMKREDLPKGKFRLAFFDLIFLFSLSFRIYKSRKLLLWRVQYASFFVFIASQPKKISNIAITKF